MADDRPPQEGARTRILVITNMYPPHHLGGYELSCRDVVERWRASGHHVTVLTSDLHLPDVADGAESTTEVRRELPFYWRDHEIVKPSLWDSMRIERKNRTVLDAVIADARPDVVSAWHMGAMSLGLLADVEARRLPLVLVVCDDWLIYAPQMDAWNGRLADRPVSRALAGGATRVPAALPRLRGATFCFVSEWIKDRAAERSRWQPATSTISYTGIDPKDFPAGEDRTARSWSSRLLYVGRVEERKGVHVAVEALASLPDAHLTICGPVDGGYVEHLLERAAELTVADRITLTRAERHDLGRVYRSADALLFPVIWDEPFGLVPVEAMACATPVIGTVGGGSREYLADGANCVAVARNDAAALAKAVRRLAEDPELRSRIVDGGRITAEELSVDTYAANLEHWHHAAATGAEHEAVHRPALMEALAARGLSVTT